MAEKDDLLEQYEFYQWLETLDLDRPLSELVEHADVLEPPQFEPEELERLEDLGREYARSSLSGVRSPIFLPWTSTSICLSQSKPMILSTILTGEVSSHDCQKHSCSGLAGKPKSGLFCAEQPFEISAVPPA